MRVPKRFVCGSMVRSSLNVIAPFFDDGSRVVYVKRVAD